MPEILPAGRWSVKPYYADDHCMIYNARWQEVVAVQGSWLGREIAVVTDQPFGTGWVRGGGAVGEFNARQEKPDWDVFDLSFTRSMDPQFWAVFAPNSRKDETVAAIPRASVVWWRKTNPRPGGPDREPIVLGPISLPAGIEFPAYNGDTDLHPCQKPIALMQWVLGFVDRRLIVLDPFMGSGSTLVAARDLGRRSIGIEQNEQYCEIAAMRLQQQVMELGA